MENEKTVKKYMLEEAVACIDLLTGKVCTEMLAGDACEFFDDFGPTPYPIPEEYYKWAFEVAEDALGHWSAGSKYEEEDLDTVVEEILRVVEDMLDISAENFSWAVAKALRTLMYDFAVGAGLAVLRDRMFEFAQVAIRCRTGVPATVEKWRLIDARGHEVIASVTVTTDDGDQEFTVWVVANLDTEEVYCL